VSPEIEAELDAIQREAFDYFATLANPVNGLVPDSTRDHSPASIATVGLALSAYLVGVHRGWMSRNEAAQRTLTTLRFFAGSQQGESAHATGHKGFYYHFLDMETGLRKDDCELSLIDSGMLFAGMLSAAAFFDAALPAEREIREHAECLFARADFCWALDGRESLAMGWKPECGFLNYDWDGYTEATILYVLGLGAVFFGDACFTSHDAVEVGGARLSFARAVIATGARAKQPDIPGLAQTGFLTNETVFNLTEQPKRLLVIGGGPLSCEIAQAFRRLGSEVTIIHRGPHFLPQEERDGAQLLNEAFQRDGIQLHLNTEVQRVERSENGKVLHLIKEAKQTTVEGDEIVVGAGRVPNVQNLGLETAGVEYDEKKGVHVNDGLRTSNPRIYAAGDICLATQYTHMAEASARIVVQNALFAGRKKLSDLVVPWCTYTDPEIAHVGLYVKQARMQKIPVHTYTVPMNDVDRAILDGEEVGFVKISVRAGTDKIIGATIVGRHAGDMINEITLAMVAGVGLKTIGAVIHSYPTQAEAIRRAADAYNKTRLTPFRQRLAARWLAWRLGR